ncbi:hypothetical protein DFH29DRAFT_245740 [Suillus ampliporus]|nr:hypothetical protein DFH29DRAFT_245740 [Suillus ampliporus]
MITPQFLAHILSALKKWFLQPARRSASLFSILLSLLRRFTTCHSKPGDARSTTQPRLSSGVLPRTREGDIAGYDPPTCSSLLPSGQMLEATREPLYPSDDPYPRTLSLDSRPLREGTTMSFLGSNQTTTGYPGAADSGGAETNGLNSMSNLHLSPQTRESSMRYPKHRRPIYGHYHCSTGFT